MNTNTLENLYFTLDEIKNSPSRKHGISEEIEDNLRRYGTDIIQDCGILLKFPQVTTVSSQVIFNRFYCRQSFKVYDIDKICMGILFIASKYTEAFRAIRHIVNVYHHVKQRKNGITKQFQHLETTQQLYWDLKSDVIQSELIVLKEFGFTMKVEPPHKFILNYMKLLDGSNELAQKAWNFLNDCMRTVLPVVYRPEALSATAIYMASRMLKVNLPEEPYPWWEIFDTTRDEIEAISLQLYNLYTKPKPYYISLEDLNKIK